MRDHSQDRLVPSTEPDLLAEIGSARAREYALLSTLLLTSPDAELLGRLARLGGGPNELGQAHDELAAAAAACAPDDVEREHFELFVGVGRGALVPYASYYLTGFLQERPLARLRQDLAAAGLQRCHGCVEPEDHIGVLCEIMSRLVLRAPLGDRLQRTMFERHLEPWAPHFFDDLGRAEQAQFYRRVAKVGRLFFQIEAEAFRFAIPEPADAEV
ncbi:MULTISPECIES: TorD/DmsD family molecular chaperone [unclassified Alsobacter]|jgi:TorA maturation chaperone TorD|uniref:Molecular chaperone TorD family protein n=1 Tax=Alsobacter sp. KACC 23698 TaxID=3149229 RepID=A0AAU7JI14_9HYPH